MRVHWLQHVPFEGLGSIEEWTSGRASMVSCTRLFDDPAFPDLSDFDLLIIMGGPMAVHDEHRFSWLIEEKRFIRRSIEAEKYVLGICLGAQLIADVLGAEVYPGPEKEIGWFPVHRIGGADSPISGVLPETLEAFHWHGDTFDIPDGAIHLMRSEACENQAFAYDDRVLGLQFHFEATPASARSLIQNCADELVDGPFIQPADAMLLFDERFRAINQAMSRLLDAFVS